MQNFLSNLVFSRCKFNPVCPATGPGCTAHVHYPGLPEDLEQIYDISIGIRKSEAVRVWDGVMVEVQVLLVCRVV